MARTRFRWVFCQLETLQQCLPQSVRRTLNELPESLDDTYERVMMGIKRANQSHAYRMLQCLTVAISPLTVAELAELLAFDFDVAEGEMPKLNSNWRWEDHEEAVLSTCSSLVTVVPNDGSPVVQFSHFSVKEYLMSDRLATSTRDISQYHISLEAAHTLLAQASLAVLLRDPDVINQVNNAPLAGYAAQYWMKHAQVENVASRVCDGMEDLFDSEKPYFEAWIQLHDMDRGDGDGFPNVPVSEPGARPLYYAALCGFYELVEHLTSKSPQSASARGGLCGTPLHSASFKGHLTVVRYLLRHGVDANVRDSGKDTSLLLASWRGHRDVVQCLLEHGADVDLQDGFGNTPLMLAASHSHVDVVRMLLEHNADANLPDSRQSTPLIWAARQGNVDVVRVLLVHNADVHSQDDHSHTPLHKAILAEDLRGDYPRVVRLLLEHGANANARDSGHCTPLHLASESDKPARLDVLRILLEHGADIHAEDMKGKTALQLSIDRGDEEVARLLSGIPSSGA